MYELGIRVTVQSLGKKNLTYELFTAEYGQISDKSCFFSFRESLKQIIFLVVGIACMGLVSMFPH